MKQSNDQQALEAQLEQENELTQIFVTKTMKFTGVNREAILKAVADDLNEQKIIFNSRNISHVQYINSFIKKLAFTYVNNLAYSLLGEHFSVQSINMGKLMLSDVNGITHMSRSDLPNEVVELLLVLS